MFWGTKDINIPPQSTFDTGVKYQPALAGTKTFALTTHQHHLGTRMQVWYGAGEVGASEVVADAKSWSDPPLEIFDPPLDFPVGDGGAFSTKGLAYQCKYLNPTPIPVTFGEGFNDEMCFLWQYYFPSRGFQICADGACKTNGSAPSNP